MLRIRRAVPALLGRSVSGATDRLPAVRIAEERAPLLSVIVPVYNVEDYVEKCLDSLVSQTLEDLEIIVVIDGSTDGSEEIVRRYAAEHPQIRVISQPNAGLGAARNTGVRHARGTYLTFVDSDDRVARTAFARMVASLESSGSDLAVGGYALEYVDGRIHVPAWQNEPYAEDRQRVTVHEVPELLRNFYSPNKVYRRTFWDNHGFAFREVKIFEDQPTVTEILTRAGSIDVVRGTVYYWYKRQDRSSLSNGWLSVDNIANRAEAVDLTRRALQAQGGAHLDAWLLTLFQYHYAAYVSGCARLEPEHFQAVREMVLEDLRTHLPRLADHIDPWHRRLYDFVLENDLDGLRAFVRHRAHDREAWVLEHQDGGVTARLVEPLEGGDLRTPVSPSTLLLETNVRALRTEHDVLQIEGWSAVRGLVASDPAPRLALWLEDQGEEAERVELDVEPFVSEDFLRSSKLPEVPDHPTGFRAAVDLARLAALVPRTLLLRGEMRLGDIVVPLGRLWLWRGARVQAPRLLHIADGVAISSVPRPGGRLTLEVKRHRYSLETARRAEETLELEVRDRDATEELPTGALLLARDASGKRRRLKGEVVARERQGVLCLRFAKIETWLRKRELSTASLRLIHADGSRSTVDLDGLRGDDVRTELGGGLTLEPSSLGALLVALDWRRAVVDSWTLTEDALELRGFRGRHLAGARAVLRSTKHTIAGELRLEGDGRWAAHFPLVERDFLGRLVTPPRGGYALRFLHDDDCEERPWGTTPRTSDRALAQVETGPRLLGRIAANVEEIAVGSLGLVIHAPLAAQERGIARERKARRDYAASTAPVVGNRVLFTTFWGESVTDSALAVHHELVRKDVGLELLWTVKDHSTAVPEGGRAVVRGSAEWYEALATSAVLFDNLHVSEFVEKRPGQRFVQTLHGYPFKLAGVRHILATRDEAALASHLRRTAMWDYLVSPATYATPLLREDFPTEGEVLEIGYPRNDVFFSARGAELRELTRRFLGIDEDKKVVLFAPTWRDYLSSTGTSAPMFDELDVLGLLGRLDPSYVVLIRGHGYNRRLNARFAEQHPGVRDVTDFPDIQALCLASDAAILDYSSLRFDYGLTGRPMVFFAPDRDVYFSEGRPSLLPYLETTPGPVVDTTEEVAAELADLDGLTKRTEEARAAFRARFLDLEDGHASERLIAAVWGL